MKLIDLLKSDFKRYQFLCEKSQFAYGTEIEFEKTQGDTTYSWMIKLDTFYNGNEELYDLSYCVSRDNHCTNANWVAKIIDMSKQFEFDSLQHEDDTLYILVRRKK